MRNNPRMSPEQKHIFRDACVFAFKLWLDGLKDVVLAFIGIGAALMDIVRGPQPDGYLFYKVMRIGHRLDEAIDLYGSEPPPESLGTGTEPHG